MKPTAAFLLFLLTLCPLRAAANDLASVESEALEISERLRCLVCSDENIEKATDETAKDLRFFIRRHLNDGKDADLVVNLVLAQYGEMVSPEETVAPSNSAELRLLAVCFAAVFSFTAASVFTHVRKFRSETEEKETPPC